MSNNNLHELLKYTQSLNILFVEDNYEVRVQLIKLLENFFKNIDVEIDGQSALNKFIDFKKEKNKYYDLIITDLSMPKLDGINFCKNILKENSEQLIIVISAHTESDKLLNLINIGVHRFLQKPVDYRELIKTLSSIVEKIQSRQNYEKLEQEVKNIKNTNEVLNKLAITDKLTSIHNRRYIDAKLTELFVELKKPTKKELSIIFIDVDNFKQINDIHGHIIGDIILKEISNILKSNIRSDELLGRWGGEEFIIICDNCPIEKAKELAQRLRKTIEEESFSKVSKLTASFGVSSYKIEDTITSLIQRADHALYKAKKEGKNKVCSINCLK